MTEKNLKKKMSIGLVVLMSFLTFSACSEKAISGDNSVSSLASESETVSASESSSTAISDETSTSIASSGTLTEDDARAIFDDNFPGVAIDIFRLEDDNTTYYMQAMSDGKKYILKVKIETGEILVKKEISTGKP